MSTSAPTHELHFVIGGAGFLGSHIVRALVNRGESAVASFDLREATERVPNAHYYEGDMTQRAALERAIASAQADTRAGADARPVVVYHTASPVAGLGPAVYEKVNVVGTETVIDVCQVKENHVEKLIFTSSAGVVFNGSDLLYVDERLNYPLSPMDAYNDTKARAEVAVLDANTEGGLKTVSLRPAGIFGPGDRQALPGFFKALATGKTCFQIGNNTNLFDWTYVENVAHAHLLASDRLGVRGAPPQTFASAKLLTEHLPERIGDPGDSATDRDVPTSIARQDVAAPVKDYARDVKPFFDFSRAKGVDALPVFRNRFDALYHHAHPKVPCGGNPRPDLYSFSKSQLSPAGEAFFITNGQPLPFWDFPRTLWYRYNGHVDDMKHLIVLSLWIALWLAWFAEIFSWISGRSVQFTRYRVKYTATSRYYNIEKARRILGYEPLFGLDEGINRSVAWWKTVHPPSDRHGETRKTK